MKRDYILQTDAERRAFCAQIMASQEPVAVSISEPTRNLEQNAKFHVTCDEVAQQAQFMNRKLQPVQWKVLFVSGHAIATGIGSEIVPGLEGEFVNIRESTARMGVKRMSSLIEYQAAWVAEHEIRLTDTRYQGYREAAA